MSSPSWMVDGTFFICLFILVRSFFYLTFNIHTLPIHTLTIHTVGKYILCSIHYSLAPSSYAEA